MKQSISVITFFFLMSLSFESDIQDILNTQELTKNQRYIEEFLISPKKIVNNEDATEKNMKN